MNQAFIDFVRYVVGGDLAEVSRRLAASPSFAATPSKDGATRQDASTFFFTEIYHYLYPGDTALHMAAAAFQRPVAELLVAHEAYCRAKNCHGAEPLHYAADTNHWDPMAQADTIKYLLLVGADPNGLDNSGVAPLHRAVRTRSSPAVQALLAGGASPTAPNKAGSTPLHLAVQKRPAAVAAVPSMPASSRHTSSSFCWLTEHAPPTKTGEARRYVMPQ